MVFALFKYKEKYRGLDIYARMMIDNSMPDGIIFDKLLDKNIQVQPNFNLYSSGMIVPPRSLRNFNNIVNLHFSLNIDTANKAIEEMDKCITEKKQ